MQMADAMHMPNFDAVDNDLNANPAKGKGQGKGQGGFGNRMINYEKVRTAAAHRRRTVHGQDDARRLQRAAAHEMMVDFWFNHFNVFAAKGADRWLITSYERDAIRPHAMGKFRDLLGATAKSPAMLFFLDNWLSADPVAWQKLQQEQQERRQMRRRRIRRRPFRQGRSACRGSRNGNPNDPNAQRETEAGARPERKLRPRTDGTAHARRGWRIHAAGRDQRRARRLPDGRIRQPRRDPEFFFDERLHDTSAKTVLGHQIHAGGMKDGEEVLDILARDPHTAHHISFELAQRFVSDNPPAALVDRMAQTFLKTDGDIREVLRTMIYSPEFWSKDAYRAKIKTPFELVASATRAVGAEVDVPLHAGAMDQPHRPAALSVRASHRLLRQGRCLGEYRRAAQSDEFFAGAHVQSPARRAGGYGCAARQRCGCRSARHARPRDSSRCWAARCRRKRATRSKSS